ncbi:MAG: energy transducer TonB [Bacteroidales bacterium]|nr:energy transducer TonB [Bacteroidales bacterium]MDY0141014.1 energy transducer TonB [Bacteroidales bacterium]
MRKTVILLCVLATVLTSFAQDYSDPQNMDVEYNRDADYPGGVNKFITDLWDQMEYTQDAIDALIDGEIMVSFDVKPDSTISGVSIISGLGHGIDEEFTRILLSMKFKPALVEGTPIKMNMMLSVPIRVGPKSKLKLRYD